MQKLGQFLLAHTGRAAFLAFLCTLSPMIGLPLGFLSVLLVGFVTLSQGLRSGLFVLAWVALPALALLFLHRYSLLDTLLVDSLVVCFLAYVLRRWGWSWVFHLAAAFGVLLVVGIHLVFPQVHAWWMNTLTKYLSDIHSVVSWKLTAAHRAAIVEFFFPIATGVMVFVGLFWLWLVLVLARAWQTSIECPGRLRKEFITVRNPVTYSLFVLLGFLGVLLKQAIIVDVFPVLLFPVFMSGLSFLHYVVEARKKLLVLLVFVYLLLLFLPLFVVLFLAILGFLDAWINFRKYLKLKFSEVGA